MPEKEKKFGHVKYVEEIVRPDYISYYDPIVEYYIVDVKEYLPERRRLELEKKEEQKSKSSKSSVADESSLLTGTSDDRAFNLNPSVS